MLEMKNKILVLIFCFFILSVPGVYGNNTSGIIPQVFDELKLQINYYNLYTTNSWFQPVVIRKKPGVIMHLQLQVQYILQKVVKSGQELIGIVVQ
jgi:hypothetical protein